MVRHCAPKAIQPSQEQREAVGSRVALEIMLFDLTAFEVTKGAAHDVEGTEAAVVAQQLWQMRVHQHPDRMCLPFPLHDCVPGSELASSSSTLIIDR